MYSSADSVRSKLQLPSRGQQVASQQPSVGGQGKLFVTLNFIGRFQNNGLTYFKSSIPLIPGTPRNARDLTPVTFSLDKWFDFEELFDFNDELNIYAGDTLHVGSAHHLLEINLKALFDGETAEENVFDDKPFDLYAFILNYKIGLYFLMTLDT